MRVDFTLVTNLEPTIAPCFRGGRGQNYKRQNQETQALYHRADFWEGGIDHRFLV
jgi:hypothetical protein